MEGNGEKDETTTDDLLAFIEDLERQLKAKDEEISEMAKLSIGTGRRTGTAMQEKVKSLEEKALIDEQTIANLSKDLADLNLKLAQLAEAKDNAEKVVELQQKQIEALTNELRDIKKDKQPKEQTSNGQKVVTSIDIDSIEKTEESMEVPLGENTTNTVTTDDDKNINENTEINILRKENAKLMSELAEFDEGFFEEIEKLKTAHAEAMKKLKMFEQQFGPLDNEA